MGVKFFWPVCYPLSATRKNCLIFKLVVFFVLAFAVLTGCNNPSGSGNDGQKPEEPNDPAEIIPNTPTEVVAEAISSSVIEISWTPVSNAQGYIIFESPVEDGTYDEIGTVSKTDFEHTGLEPNTTYYYRVSAFNNAGESSKSEFVYAVTHGVVPAVPVEVKAEAASSSAIEISWNPVSNADGYKIFKSSSENGTYDLLEDVSTESVEDTGLAEGSSHYYKVSAYNIMGESEKSNAVYATTVGPPPGMPGNVIASGESSSRIKVSWDFVPNATRYFLYQSMAPGGTYVKVNPSPETDYFTGNAAEISSLSSGTIFYYKVSAWNSNGESTQSIYVAAKTSPSGRPPAPTGVSVSAVSNLIRISFNPVPGATRYYVYVSSNSTSGFLRLYNAANGNDYFPANTGSVTLNNLPLNSFIYVRVSAYNSNGEGLQSSASAYNFSIPVAPWAPYLDSASLISSDTVKLEWSIEPFDVHTGYYVYASIRSTGPYIKVGATANKFAEISGLYQDMTYYFKVSAFDGNGEGVLQITPVSITTPAEVNHFSLSERTWYDNTIAAGEIHYYKIYTGINGYDWYINWEDAANSESTADVRIGFKRQGASSYIINVTDLGNFGWNKMILEQLPNEYFIIEVRGVEPGTYRLEYER